MGNTLASNISTTNLGTYKYWFSQTTNGCESARTVSYTHLYVYKRQITDIFNMIW